MKVPLLALLSLAALAGCREPYPHPRETGAGSTAPHDGGTLRVASAFDLAAFDPASTTNPMSSYLEALLFDTLVTFAPGTATIEPDLAERWELADEGRTIRFFLRPDALFQDGSPVTADDVKGSLERMLDPERGAAGMASFFDLITGYGDFRAHRTAHLAGVVVVDAHTVEIRESDVDATALQRFALVQAAIVPVARVAKVGAAAFAKAPVGSGAYALESWERGTRVTLRRNPGYFRPGVAHVDRIVLDLNVAGSAIAMRLQRGDVDLATGWDLTSADMVWFRSHPGWASTLVTGAIAADVLFLAMNAEMPPWNNRALRRAVAFALDREAELKPTLGSELPHTTLVPPGVPGYQAHAPWAQRFDLAAARAEMAKAGYPDGLPEEQELWAYDAQDPQLVQVQRDLARIGIRVRLRSSGRDWGALMHRGVGPLVTGAWTADFPDPIDFTDPLFHSRTIADEGSFNFAFYRNPAVDHLLDGARRELSPERRLAMYAEAEQMIVEDAPCAFMGSIARTDVAMPYVRGYRVGTTPAIDLRGVWLDEPRRAFRPSP
jgi:peptide/nickel transport system substrate-binding protein